MGHIAFGHLPENGVIVDAKIERTDSETVDVQEEEANSFAASLLTGKPDIRYTAPYSLSGEGLALSAKKVGVRDQIDPGYIASNYAYNAGRFGVAMEALKLLPGNFNQMEMIRDKMCELFLRVFAVNNQRYPLEQP